MIIGITSGFELISVSYTTINASNGTAASDSASLTNYQILSVTTGAAVTGYFLLIVYGTTAVLRFTLIVFGIASPTSNASTDLRPIRLHHISDLFNQEEAQKQWNVSPSGYMKCIASMVVSTLAYFALFRLVFAPIIAATEIYPVALGILILGRMQILANRLIQFTQRSKVGVNLYIKMTKSFTTKNKSHASVVLQQSLVFLLLSSLLGSNSIAQLYGSALFFIVSLSFQLYKKPYLNTSLVDVNRLAALKFGSLAGVIVGGFVFQQFRAFFPQKSAAFTLLLVAQFVLIVGSFLVFLSAIIYTIVKALLTIYNKNKKNNSHQRIKSSEVKLYTLQLGHWRFGHADHYCL